MQLLLVVIAVVVSVLGLAFAGMYFLDKSIDQSGR
jgi:putative copper export protein